MTRPEPATLNWPTDEHRALLVDLVDLTSPGRGARLRQWAERARPPLDTKTAALLPFLHLCLQEERLSLPWLAAYYRLHWLRNQRAIQAGLETADLLRRAGIPAVLVKGVPLCLFHYREAGARPMADADLVVPAADLLAADEIIRARGWSRKIDPPAGALPFVKAIDYQHPLPASLDVQRHPFGPGSPASAVRRFFARCHEREVRGLRVLVPDATAMLILTCLHGRKPEESLARWPLDAHAILRGRDGAIDWDDLVSLVSEAEIISPVRDALAYLGDLGLPVPAEIRARLARLSPSPRDRRRYGVLARTADSWGATEVLATRWDEYAAAGDGAISLASVWRFPLYAVTANFHYRGRRLALADLWSRLVTDGERALERLGGPGRKP